MRVLAIIFFGALLLMGCTTQPLDKTNDSVKLTSSNNSIVQKTSVQQELNKTVIQQEQNNTAVEPLQNSSAEHSTLPKFNFTNVTTANGTLIVHYFHSTGCVASRALKPEIDKLEKDYPEVLFFRYNIVTQNGSIAYVTFADQYNLSRDKRYVPQVLVNGTIITDRFNINDSLGGIIANFSESA
jgi:thiol-disulfide isomerase/thioredoxin